jgi:2-dehydro-3-deoxygalactonokinase
MVTALIAIDWARPPRAPIARCARPHPLDERAPLGVQKVEPGKFSQALTALLGGDVPDGVPMIACGMIGSRQGWIEAPYRDCPADFDGVAAALTPVPGTRLCIVPGLVCRDADGVPDVMRGEETQIMGALDDQTWAQAAPRVVVLPGTHSKWARVGGRVIAAFATFMTGELYAAARAQHPRPARRRDGSPATAPRWNAASG